MLTVIVVNITDLKNHYHVVIIKLVTVTLLCSDVHYTVFTVYSRTSIIQTPMQVPNIAKTVFR